MKTPDGVGSPAKSAMRRLPVGAEVQPAGGVHFRTWAPASATVAVAYGGREALLKGTEVALTAEPDGYWSGLVAEARAGTRYGYRLDSGTYPDVASRCQPDGPHGASEVIDPSTYAWTDESWAGAGKEGQIIYEMHIGTFTQGGTWSSAISRLPHLVDLGVTMLEVMPVAEFPGQFGWGYDGVNLFAPTRLYGAPDDFRRFVDRAHALGLAVILDVVYNHMGPDGNFMRAFAPSYFSVKHATEWGEALNFDGQESAPVREFFTANAGYWMEEFHLDGLRLDATQMIYDASEKHILSDITAKVREKAGRRASFIVGENEPQEATLIRPVERGGYGLDALWNDDFHHSAMVALTGRDEAYYTDYRGSPQEFISAVKWGFIYQGQRYKWQKGRRGTPTLDFESWNFVNFLQNHDQVANSLAGRRIHSVASAGRLRALTALLLLGPNTPMLFQGQEFAASTPFLYFADHNPDLAKLVAEGRAKFLGQFPSIASENAAALVPSPELEQTFQRCKLDFADGERHAEMLALHRDLIQLRKKDPLLSKALRGTFDGSVLSPTSFLLRYFGRALDDRLLIVNLGSHVHLDPAPDPLLAPPPGCEWELAWSSEEPRYGGSGTPPVESADNWHLPAEATVLLIARELRT